jgi:shikimate dehydrogenase
MYLLGSEISHSASPAHWKKTFEEKGLSWTYELADINDETEAKKFIESKDFVAINITTPWKKLAFQCADETDGASKFAGGSNFLVNKSGTLSGYNVDGEGCVEFLKSTGFDFSGRKVYVCGFGPTAKSIAVACKSACAQVCMLSRTASEERVKLCEEHGISLKGYVAELADANLVINATTLGMKSGDDSVITLDKMTKTCVYFDCIYGHGKTQFIQNAMKTGASCFDGAGMLEAQAKKCEEILFGDF